VNNSVPGLEARSTELYICLVSLWGNHHVEIINDTW